MSRAQVGEQAAFVCRVRLVWVARLLVDPFVCSRCGQRMTVIAFLLSIRRNLDHLGLGTPPRVALANRHAGIWWGALLVVIGLGYVRAFRPRR